MRARLAVLIAIVVVFAPGWGADRSAGQKRGPSDIGARMLAPTFDDAADSAIGSAQKLLDRVSLRSEPSKLLPWRAADGVPTLPLGLILAIAVALSSFHLFEGHRPRLGRAPPRLLTV